MNRRMLAQGFAVAATALLLSGCAAPIVAGMTLGTLSTIAGLVSTAVTGKGLSDHALSWVTGKDCDIVEGILRKERKFCEEPGSLAAADDFKGIFVAFGGKDADPLDRVARARQEELAAAAAPASVHPAQIVSSSLLSRAVRIFDGVPRDGDAGLARVNGSVVYLMPPIYSSDGAPPVPTPRPQRSTGL